MNYSITEQVYAQIFENSSIGIIQFDSNGVVTKCNRAHLKIIGAEESQVLGIPMLETITDKQMLRTIQAALNGERKTFLGNYVSITGRRSIRIKFDCAPLFDEKGKVIGGAAICEDLSDRTRIEKDLQIQTAYLEELFEGSPEVIAILDNDDRILKINREFTRVFGYTIDEVKSKPINDLIVPEEFEAEGQQATETVANGGSVDFEAIRLTKDGRRIHVSVLGKPVVFQGVQLGIYAIYRDITAAKQSEEKRRISEERYRRLVETSPDAIIQIDLDGRIAEANPLAVDLFGFADKEALLDSDPSISSYLNPQKKRDADRFLRDVRNNGTVNGVEFDLFDKSGNKHSVEISASLPDYKGDQTPSITCFIRDISTRKETEKLLQETEEQLRQSQKMEAVGRLAGGIAHDFNNLLTAIGGNVEMAMMKTSADDPIHGFLSGVEEAADRAAGLTRSLLAFSRRQPMELKIVDLNDILFEMDKMLRRIIGEDIHLITLPAYNLWSVRVDPSQMEHVIVNLAVNARDAMPKGGTLTIRTSNIKLSADQQEKIPDLKPGNYVMLSIDDDGEGMPPDVQEKIFEPFFTTKEKGKGTGLGMSTVYGIVKQVGGNITLSSNPDHGTSVEIYLPMVDAEASDLHQRKTYFETPHGSERLLVVEDEYSVRNLAVTTLERLGYKVFEAGSGKEALEVCYDLDSPVDLVITDVIMPQMNGADMAKEIRRSIWPEVKILFVSGYTEDAIVHDGFLEPGTPYLQKPFRLVDLAKRVREELDS